MRSKCRVFLAGTLAMSLLLPVAPALAEKGGNAGKGNPGQQEMKGKKSAGDKAHRHGDPVKAKQKKAQAAKGNPTAKQASDNGVSHPKLGHSQGHQVNAAKRQPDKVNPALKGNVQQSRRLENQGQALVKFQPGRQRDLMRLVNGYHLGGPGNVSGERLVSFPPGIEKKLQAGETIPPGILKQIELLPLNEHHRLGLPTTGNIRVGVVGDDVLLMNTKTGLVLDVFNRGDESVMASRDAQILYDPVNRVILRDVLRNYPDRYQPNWLERLFRLGGLPYFIGPSITVGESLPDALEDDLRLLPLTVNQRLGLPVSEDLRVGVVNDNVILLDTANNIVLDSIYRDSVLTDEPGRLVRFQPEDRDILKEVLMSNPVFLDGHAYERPVAIINPDRLSVGQALPTDLEPFVNFLPKTVNRSLGLDDSGDIRVGIIDDNAILYDTKRNVVLDVLYNVI